MKIKAIRIKEFKSIKSLQTVELGEGGLVTLVGKNGSGKTNILEAIKNVFYVNTHEYLHGIKKLKYSIKLELDGETLKELNSIAKTDLEEKYVEVFNDGYENDIPILKANVFNSRTYAEALKGAASAVKSQAQEVTDKLEDFSKALKEISVERGGFFYKIEHLERAQTCEWGSNNYTHYYNSRIERLPSDVEEIVKSLCDDEENIKIYGYDGHSYSPQTEVEFPEPCFKLEYCEPFMTEFDKQFIVTVKRDEIKSFIEKFNNEINTCSKQLKQAVQLLNEKIKTFNSLTQKAREEEDREYIKNQEIEKKGQDFMSKIRSAIGRRCFFIPGGNDLMFSEDRGYGYDRQYNYNDLIVETYIRLKYDGEERNKILEQYYKNRKLKEVVDEKSFAEDFEAELNKTIPTFDRGMINKIAVEYDGGIKLFVIEKDNTKTEFARTSLGRRWYFTYYFIKNSLKSGDVLILDEPGAFLHPEAQIELLHELEELAKTNTVILCTHSPYMISEKNNSLHVVRMQEDGTAVKRINLKSLEKLRKDTGLTDFNSIGVNSIILNFPREVIICEGKTDVACLNAFMDYFKVDKGNYNLMYTMGFTKAKPVIEFYLNNNRHVRILLDKDSEKEVLEMKIKVPKDISANEKSLIRNIPKQYLTLAFAGGESGKDIEGLFSQEDRKKFLNNKKAHKKSKKVREDIGEILAREGCSEKTKENFRKLFEELLIL